MVEVETLEALGLTSLLLPAWPVMLYAVLVSLFVLIRRIQLCLLTTFLFTFYWGFYLNWGPSIATGTNLVTFAGYVICGLAIIALTIVVGIPDDNEQHQTELERLRRENEHLRRQQAEH
jgi:hypothetical protein